MLKLKAPDMSCGHCAAVVTKAVKDVDASATVDIDLESRTIVLETAAEPAVVSHALDRAGYPATVG